MRQQTYSRAAKCLAPDVGRARQGSAGEVFLLHQSIAGAQHVVPLRLPFLERVRQPTLDRREPDRAIACSSEPAAQSPRDMAGASRRFAPTYPRWSEPGGMQSPLPTAPKLPGTCQPLPEPATTHEHSRHEHSPAPRPPALTWAWTYRAVLAIPPGTPMSVVLYGHLPRKPPDLWITL
jgi:hypothetical protein